MLLTGVIYQGPELDDLSGLISLPPPLRAGLLAQNGCVALRGGLHLRGMCKLPSWHDLHAVWRGAYALHRLFPLVQPGDVPFGQDFRGDQLLYRRDEVVRLTVATGEVEGLGVDLPGFLAAVRCDPVDYLGLQPLFGWLDRGGCLRPGRVLDLGSGAMDGWFRSKPALQAIREAADLLGDRSLAAS